MPAPQLEEYVEVGLWFKSKRLSKFRVVAV